MGAGGLNGQLRDHSEHVESIFRYNFNVDGRDVPYFQRTSTHRQHQGAEEAPSSQPQTFEGETMICKRCSISLHFYNKKVWCCTCWYGVWSGAWYGVDVHLCLPPATNKPLQYDAKRSWSVYSWYPYLCLDWLEDWWLLSEIFSNSLILEKHQSVKHSNQSRTQIPWVIFLNLSIFVLEQW